MQANDAAARAELVQLDAARVVAPILLGDVIALFALGASQRNVCAYGFLCHLKYLPPTARASIIPQKAVEAYTLV